MTDKVQGETFTLELFDEVVSPIISPNGTFPDTNELPHPKNKLNELPGGQWLYFTKTLLTTAYPAQYGHQLRKKHGANKPPQLMKTLIEYFTKGDELVLDPFAGVGGTLIGATIAHPPRKAIGIEINREWSEIYNQVKKTEGLASQELILGDCVTIMREMKDQTFDFIATDPPYNIHLEQTMSNDRYAKEFSNRRTDYNMRSEEGKDLANLNSYEEYLAAMTIVFEQCFRLLKNDKYMVFIVRDAYQDGEYIMTHADLTNAARKCGFKNKGDIIWYQAGTRLRPYGYPYAFVPNIVHQHIIILHKPKQKKFGEALRASGVIEGESDTKQSLSFQRQADTITVENLAWTARARFGTFKFLGFTHITKEGYADLTEAGRRIIYTKRPDIIMLKQLIKWQYPDNQHKGKTYSEGTFHIWPFMAVSQLIMELGGLTKQELALFCFTMTTMQDIAKARKAIADFRVLYAREKGKIPKRQLVSTTRKVFKEQAREQGFKLPADSFRDYADALGRYMRYPGLFSISGNRIIVAKGREIEVQDILKLKLELHSYTERDKFYYYYGNPDLPILTTDVDPTILKLQIASLASGLTTLSAELGVLNYGVALDSPLSLPQTMPNDIEELRTLLDNLRDEKKKVEFQIMDIRGRGPEKLAEALEFYDNIINHQTFDDATYLEWNTWRVFVALDRAKKVKPNLLMDENLQPVNPALGGGPDIEVSFDTFHIVSEVTLRRGTNQAYYETYPVIRHIEDFMQKVNNQETYGLFIAPRCHQDTIHQFYNSWKFGGYSGKIVKIVPVTVNQFKDIAYWYVSKQDFQPNELRLLFKQVGEALQSSQSSQEWNNRLPSVIAQWKQQIRNNAILGG